MRKMRSRKPGFIGGGAFQGGADGVVGSIPTFGSRYKTRGLVPRTGVSVNKSDNMVNEEVCWATKKSC